MLNELANLRNECSRPGWDGYDALPVLPDTVQLAQQLIDISPVVEEGLQRSIGAEADGSVTVEWHKSPSWTLSVSVSASGELHYAALLGASNATGTAALDLATGFPDEIQKLIGKIGAG